MKAKKKSVVDRIPNWAWLLISLAAALLVWTALSYGTKTGRSFCHPWEMPGIFMTVAVERGILLSDTAGSLLTVLAGYLIGFAISLPLAILMAWYRPVRYVVQPWIQFIRNIPPLAYVPLIVLMLGVGPQPQITVITIATTLIMSITIYQGVVNIDETLIKAARVLGAKDKDVFVRVIAPASLPFILTAARLGASTALTTLIAAESVGSGLGLKSKGVETAADLKGKVIGYAPGTSSEAILKKVLAEAGLSESDVNLMSMDADGIVTAMIGGSLDAATLWSPSTLKVEEQMGDDVVTLADNMTYAEESASISSWIVMPKFAEENHDLLVRFTRALYKAKDYRADMTHAEEISEYIAKETGLDKETVYAQRGDAEWLTSEEMLAQIEDGTLAKLYQSQQDGFIATGDVAATVPLEDYILWDVMEEAAA